MRCNLLFIFACLLFAGNACAQKTPERGWFFLSHTQKVGKKLDVLADVQVRSTEQIRSVNTLLLRTALSYRFNDAHSAAVGYVSKNDWEHGEAGIVFKPEHRIYQQYLFQTKIARTEFTTRARFEQRFVKDESRFLFSQRARVFAAFQIPLFANHDFTRGVYFNLQDELFCNVTNQANVNDAFFDQNRLLGSFGYRWFDGLDTEFGYMWWRQKESDGFVSSNVFQIMVTTSF